MKTAVLSVVALVLGMTATAQAGLINTSPIDTWEGAGAVHNNAGGGVVLWFLILLALMLIVIISAAKAEKDHEREHG
tara:strand:+ start:1786 stop:2016 length:231 start_codon:yes stop_codon:yes gene_type:complete